MESRRVDWRPAPGRSRHARPRQAWFARSVTGSVAGQAQCELGAVEGRPEIGRAQLNAERGARIDSAGLDFQHGWELREPMRHGANPVVSPCDTNQRSCRLAM